MTPSQYKAWWFIALGSIFSVASFFWWINESVAVSTAEAAALTTTGSTWSEILGRGKWGDGGAASREASSNISIAKSDQAFAGRVTLFSLCILAVGIYYYFFSKKELQAIAANEALRATMLTYVDSTQVPTQREIAERHPCKDCAEMILDSAQICHFCRAVNTPER